MTETNRRVFIRGLLGLTTLAVGGCFSVPDDPYADIPLEPPKDRPACDEAFAKLKTAHVRSARRDGIDTEAEELLASPIVHLNPGYPVSAECVLIDGSAERPYPFESIVRIDFAEKGVRIFWYDGGVQPLTDQPIFPMRDLVYLSRDERRQIGAIIEIIKTAKQTPGRLVKAP